MGTQLFDNWADTYDDVVRSCQGFPFEGYEQVLDEVCSLANVRSEQSILDLGTGTGNLAKRFADLGCVVYGIDFSSKMLASARAKLPQVRFIQANLMDEWPPALNRRFDRIVSAYVLHEFDLASKVKLLKRLATHHLEVGGRMVIADIAFPTIKAREKAHSRWINLWDEDEFYWAADEVKEAFAQAGLEVGYVQISACGGVFVFEPLPYSPQ